MLSAEEISGLCVVFSRSSLPAVSVRNCCDSDVKIDTEVGSGCEVNFITI